MKEFSVTSKRSISKVDSVLFLKEKDIKESLKSCAPGEWCRFKFFNDVRLGFVNTFHKSGTSIVVLSEFKDSVENYLTYFIRKAIQKRKDFKNLDEGSRLIYGDADGLPGIICDEYKNVIILQINKAGIDLHREFVRKCILDICDKKVVILDNPKDRSFEGLPNYNLDELPEELEIEESGFRYLLKKEQVQKNGYYYDHRNNRLKMETMLSNLNRKIERGLDLFCYLGSWSLHALRSNVEHMTLVDQANMEENIKQTMKLNNFSQNYSFERSDVFKFLEKNDEQFDLIISDPPAFSKSEKNKKSAIVGYDKLHRNALRKLHENGIFIAASCTKYVSIEELDKSVQKAATFNNRRIQLVDIGLQGQDHPMIGLQSNNNYIKYLFYLVE